MNHSQLDSAGCVRPRPATVGRQSGDSRATIGRQSDDSGATVERQSGDWRVAAGERTTRVRLKV